MNNDRLYSKVLANWTASWNQAELWQKATLLLAGVIILTLLLFAPTLFKSEKMILLLSAEQTRGMNILDIKSKLDHAKIPNKLQSGPSIWIPLDYEAAAKKELSFSSTNTQAKETSLDKGSWLKGDKEIQLIEYQSTKKQLENDLTKFHKIREATIVFEIPTARSFAETKLKTKAAILLDLEPGQRLNQQEISAISNHLIGALKGLTFDQIAISDTHGHVYQAIADENSAKMSKQNKWIVENEIAEKVESLLSPIFTPKNFKVIPELITSPAGSETSISLSILINQDPLNKLILKKNQETFKQTLKEQIKFQLKQYPYTIQELISIIPFEQKEKPLAAAANWSRTTWLWAIFAGSLTLLLATTFALQFLIKRRARNNLKYRKKQSLVEVEKSLDTFNKDFNEKELADDQPVRKQHLYELLNTAAPNLIASTMEREPSAAVASLLLSIKTRLSSEILNHLSSNKQLEILSEWLKFSLLQPEEKRELLDGISHLTKVNLKELEDPLIAAKDFFHSSNGIRKSEILKTLKRENPLLADLLANSAEG